MPIREYRCPRCERVQEIIASYNSLVSLVCEHDGEKVVMERIQFSKPGSPQFKGTGFYATDYKDKP